MPENLKPNQRTNSSMGANRADGCATTRGSQATKKAALGRLFQLDAIAQANG
ncbi:hypothetical protein [Ectopseudomonas guguanensis]|uniref:hypothetical protein n=1 Tax=Ectopseudomonas guguanensis TaxID=1198456 RepID=UPI0028AC93B1|nr:hypothetical protein [Pseudomonas guguanensis]